MRCFEEASPKLFAYSAGLLALCKSCLWEYRSSTIKQGRVLIGTSA